MATIELATANQKKVWTAKRYDEYVRKSGFKAFMGRNANKIIHVRYDLKEEKGDTINIPLFAKLKGEPKRGSQAIEGNEQGMANFNFPITIDWVGDGVAVSNADTFKTEIDLLDAGRDGLTNFMGEVTRNDIIDAFNSKNRVRDVTGQPPASGAVRDAWVTNNADRVLFGSQTSNYATSFATALGNVDATNDLLTQKIVQLARYVARTAPQRLIRPAVVEERKGMSGEGGNIVECYVMFVGSRSFYYLKNDPGLKDDLRYAMERGVNNPLFQPDDLMIDNVIVREIPEISDRCLLAGAGNAGTDVEPYFLCGAQAVGYAIGQDPKFATDERDYGFIRGVAVRELRGIEKTIFNGPQDDSTKPVDHGMVTGFVAAPKA